MEITGKYDQHLKSTEFSSYCRDFHYVSGDYRYETSGQLWYGCFHGKSHVNISLASSYQSMNLFVCQLPGIRALVFYVIAHHDISSFCKAEYLLAREIIGEKRKIMTQNGPLPPLYIFSFFPFKLNLN